MKASRTGDANADRGVAVSGVVHGDIVVRNDNLARSRYLHQVRQIAPPVLHGREGELVELADFARAEDMTGSYRWWRAGPWAGKTALMSWFALHPPENVRVVCFFVTARLPGQSDRVAFVDAVLEQLLTILGEGPPPLLTAANREAHLLGLFTEAAEACQAAGERLVLVVDGLDEDRGYTTEHDAHSIAALLPAKLPSTLRVVVAGRPDPPIPADVDPLHPLRDPAVVRPLDNSPHAQALRREMERDFKRLLNGTVAERDLLGLLTASGGGLSADDLGQLSGTGEWHVQDHLDTAAGRSFTRRASTLAPDTAPDIYLLGHEQLQVTALDVLQRELPAYRDRIHAWAEDYRSRGWPPETPEYLLRGYHTMLLANGDIERATALCTDVHRHDRLLDFTGGDSIVSAQLAATIERHVALPAVDLAALGRLAVHRDHIADRNAHIPTRVPELWARLGNASRAIALAQSISDRQNRNQAMGYVVAVLSRTGRFDQAVHTANSITSVEQRNEVLCLAAKSLRWGRERDQARLLIDEASRSIESIVDPDRRNAALHMIVEVLADIDQHDEAVENAQSITSARQRCLALCAVADNLITRGRGDQARTLLDQAVQDGQKVTDLAERNKVWSAAVRVLARAGQHERAIRTAGLITDAHTHYTVMWAVAQSLVRAGQHQQAIDVANSLASARDRNSVLPWVAQALAEAGDDETALRLAHSVDDPDRQSAALRYVAEALARGRRHDLALRTVQSITILSKRCEAMCSIAELLTSSGQHELAQHAIEQAVDMAETVISPDERSYAFRSVAGALATAGRFDDVLRATESIVNSEEQGYAFRAVAEALASAGRYDDALRAVESIADSDARSYAYRRVISILVLAGQHDAALRATHSVTSSSDRSNVLYGIAEALVKAELHDKARQVLDLSLRAAQSNRDSVRRSEALRSAVTALAYAGHHDHAIRMVASIPNANQRSLALCAVADSLTRTQQAARSHQVLDEAVQAAQGIAAAGHRSHALRSIAQTLVRSGHEDRGRHLLDEAVRVAESIADPGRRSWALCANAEALDQVGLRVEALEILDRVSRTTSSIDRAYERNQAVRAVAEALARTGRHDRAVQVAHSVTDRELQSWTLWSIAETLIASGRQGDADLVLDHAVAAASSSSATDQRHSALWTIVGTLARVGRCDEAFDRAQSIADLVQRSRALRAIAVVHALAGRSDEAGRMLDVALGTAQSITDPSQLEWGLRAVAETMAQAGLYDRALRIARSVNDLDQQSQALCSVGAELARTGQLERGRQVFDESARAAMDTVGSWQQSRTLMWLAYMSTRYAGGYQAKFWAAKALQIGDWRVALENLCSISTAAVLAIADESEKLTADIG